MKEITAARVKQANDKVQKHKLTRAMKTGAWLMTVTNHLNDTTLSKEKFRNNLCLRYGLVSLGLQPRCNRHGARLAVEHGLTCSKGGLVLLCHEDFNQEWGALGAK
eukprot:13158031-Ditylum_brightwellii.AAC.1